MADMLHVIHYFGGVENLKGKKVAMTWAYSPSYGKPLSVPQGVIGLFTRFGMDVTLAHPEGYDAVSYTHLPQVAVFDTAFHMTMPPKAYRYAIPTKYYEEDHLRRYGFHGTSHRFVSKRAIELMGKPASKLKIIVCHLGNGSSLSAVADGKCQDTSMGLSPLAGVPMGTRAGDIDTCVAQFIMNKYNMSADECLTMLNKQSGVLALSNGLSSDFRDLEAGAKEGNEACQLALDKFCYEVRKYIGAYAAALGGLDCLVFTAGVGENGCTNRAAICEGLEFLGVKLDPERNKVRGEEALISADDSRVKVWVIPTNEELMIAQDTAELCKK